MAENRAQEMQTLADQARYALRHKDYEAAYGYCLEAQVIYDFTPDQSKDSLELRWRSIENLMRRIEALRRGAKITRIQLEYVRPDEEGWCER